LSQLLAKLGIDNIVIDRKDRAYIEVRVRLAYWSKEPFLHCPKPVFRIAFCAKGSSITGWFWHLDENNSADLVFLLAGDRANTMIARLTDGGGYIDIYLQGSKETVFFDV
jgi:hypothetical protein